MVFDLELERALWSASVVDAVRSPLPAHLLARAGFSATASVVHGGQGRTPSAPARGQRSTAVASRNAIAAPGVSKHRAGRPLKAPAIALGLGEEGDRGIEELRGGACSASTYDLRETHLRVEALNS